LSDQQELRDRFKPRVRFPTDLDRRPTSVRMRESAKGLHEVAEESGARLMLYFAGAVEEMERVQGPINHVSLWTGVSLGFLAGALFVFLVYNMM